MKKIFTLTLGLLFTLAMFAADRRPMVTVTSAKRYQIVIDGKSYTCTGDAITIPTLYRGEHDIRVYKVKPGFFLSTKKLVASTDFQLRNNDVQININRFGQVQITESRFGNDRDDHDNGWHGDNDRDHGQRDRGHRNHDSKF